MFLNFKFFHLSSIQRLFLFIFYYRHTIFLKNRILPFPLKNLPEKSVTTIFIYRWKTEIGRGIRPRQRTNVKRLSRGSSKIDHVVWNKEKESEKQKGATSFRTIRREKTNLEKKRACFIPQSSWIHATCELNI